MDILSFCFVKQLKCKRTPSTGRSRTKHYEITLSDLIISIYAGENLLTTLCMFLVKPKNQFLFNPASRSKFPNIFSKSVGQSETFVPFLQGCDPVFKIRLDQDPDPVLQI